MAFTMLLRKPIAIFKIKITRLRNYTSSIQIQKPISFLNTLNYNSVKEEQGLVKITSIESKEWKHDSVRTGVIAIKKGMTRIWDQWGISIPCTILQIKDCQVLYNKTKLKHGYDALQVGAINKPLHNVTKPLQGHCLANGVLPKYHVAEFKISNDAHLPPGTDLTSAHFIAGQFVDCIGVSKGKGFTGAMQRHGFSGLPASHGVSLTHRSIGSVGSRAHPGKVFKGKKMAGRHGGKNATVLSLKVMRIDNLLGVIFVSGPLAGPIGGSVRVRDSIKKYRTVEPSLESHYRPFPTFDPALLPQLPREIWAKSSEIDPIDKLLDMSL